MKKQIRRIFLVRTTKYVTADGIVTHKTIVGERDETQILKLERPSARTLGVLRAYLTEMGISEELQKLMDKTDSKSIHWLTHPETQTTALVTDYVGCESLLSKKTGEAAEPELPVTSLAWGIFNMPGLPGFGAQSAKLLFEFIHRRDAPVIDVNAVIDNRAEFATNSQLALILQFGPKAAEIVATSKQPSEPLTATLAVPHFCEALTKGQALTMRLQDRSIRTNTSFLTGSPVFIAAHQLSFMPDVMLDACK
jgi:hypothetical protein